MRDETLTRIGRRHGKAGGQVALRYLVQQRIAAIPRTSRVERLSENLEVFDFELDEAEMEEIRGLAKPGGRILDAAWAPRWD
jgi:diketogulonate reductase-like aldo/keto reductase